MQQKKLFVPQAQCQVQTGYWNQQLGRMGIDRGLLRFGRLEKSWRLASEILIVALVSTQFECLLSSTHFVAAPELSLLL